MSEYSIKDMELLSNVKAYTIRIWEQRYNLLTPERTDTNIRYYSDAQLKKLLNVCTLIGKGIKISQIGKLSNEEIAQEIDELINDQKQSDAQIEGMINQALIAVAAYDEAGFEGVFARSIKGLGLIDSYLKVIYPLLVRTGLMWSKDDIIPAQEHFLSNLIRKKLFSAIDKLPLPGQSDQTWVLFLHEQEKHEIGLLFANYLLRYYKKKVVYLGQEVPAANLFDIIVQCKATHAYTFFVRNYPNEMVRDILQPLRQRFQNLEICVSGQEEILGQLPSDSRIHPLKDIQSLLKVVAYKSL